MILKNIITNLVSYTPLLLLIQIYFESSAFLLVNFISEIKMLL